MANGNTTQQFLDSLRGSVERVTQSFLGQIPAVAQASQAVTAFADSVQQANQIATQITGAIRFVAQNQQALVGAVGRATAAIRTQGVVQRLTATTTRIWSGAQRALNNAFRANPLGFVLTILQYLITAIIVAYQNSATFRRIVHAAFNAIRNVAITVFNAIRNAVSVVWPYIQRVIQVVVAIIRAYITTYFRIIRAVITTVWNAIRTVITVVWRAIATVVRTYIAIVRTVITTVFNAVRAVVRAVWNFIRSYITGVVRTVVAVVQGIRRVYTIIRDAFNSARSAVGNAIGGVVRFVRGLPGRALNALGNIGSKLVNAGKDLIRGFINGIKDAAGGIVSAIKDFVLDKIPGPIKSFLGISSPSRMMAAIGLQIGEGLVVGIEGSGPRVAEAVRRLVPVPTRGAVRSAAAGLTQTALSRGVADLAPALAAGAGREVTVNVYPQPGQSEYEIGRIAARELAWAAKR